MKYNVFSKSQYFTELKKRLKTAKTGERVAIVTMDVRPLEPGVTEVLLAMAKAAKRGVFVHFIYDAYTFLVGGNGRLGPLFYRHHLPSRLTKTFHQRQLALQQLAESGVICTMVNPPVGPFNNPYAGRMHTKLALFGEYFYVGGCNLSSVDSNDLMVALKSASTVEKLWRLLDRIENTKSVKVALENRDLEIVISKNARLLIDCGMANQSLILEKTLDTIYMAKNSVLGAFYFFPRGNIAKAFSQAARRGLSVTVWMNRRFIHEMPHKLIQPLVASFRQLHLAKQIHFKTVPRGNILHAKLIRADNTTIVGSHNYDTRGVKWGTAEIAIQSNDEQFGQAVLSALEKQLG